MKKKLKLKYSNIFIFVVIVYIVVQISIYIIGYFTKCQVLKKEEVNLKFSTEAVVVMDETIIRADEDGDIKYCVSDNQKIANKKELFTVDNREIKYNVSEIKSLEAEIEKLKKDGKKINETILKNKYEQLKILKDNYQKYCTSYYSESSGIALFSFDNYFDTVKLENIENIDFNKLENNFIEIEPREKIKKGDIALRVIDSNEVYLYFEDKNQVLNKGQVVEVKFEDKLVRGIVQIIYKKDNKSMVLLKIIEQNKDIYITRIKQFDIIYKKIEGFKIPLSAVVEKDKKMGVYVVDEETKMPRFVYLNKIYDKDEKYLYVDYNKIKDSKNNLKIYDRILLYPNIINQNIKVSR